jgi:hypothetical protein
MDSERPYVPINLSHYKKTPSHLYKVIRCGKITYFLIKLFLGYNKFIEVNNNERKQNKFMPSCSKRDGLNQ